MIYGEYRIYQDGKLLVAQPNLVTTFGKDYILRYLAGINTSLGNGIAVGVGNNAPAVTDQELTFEFDRCAVNLRTVDFTTKDVIFKGTLGTGSTGKIYELGMYPEMSNSGAGSFQTKILSRFDTDIEYWTSQTTANCTVTTESTNHRVGQSGIKTTISAASTTQSHTMSYANMNLDGYSTLDTFGLAFITYTQYCESIKVTFTNAAGQTVYGTFTPAAHNAGSGQPQYQIIELTKGAFTNYSYDMTNIVSVTVDVKSNSSASGVNQCIVSLDGLRVVDKDTANPNYSLISHAVLASPQYKDPALTMDIEYALRINV